MDMNIHGWSTQLACNQRLMDHDIGMRIQVLLPFSAAESSMDPMEAAIPVTITVTSDEIIFIVS